MISTSVREKIIRVMYFIRLGLKKSTYDSFAIGFTWRN